MKKLVLLSVFTEKPAKSGCGSGEKYGDGH